MLIGGIQKCSFLDFPGKISAIIFTEGCNFRCPFCHNFQLVLPQNYAEKLNENEIFEFLKIRKNQIEGVVISGGEPTIHKDLPEFIEKIRELGLSIKLDTNGSNPDMLQDCFEQKLLDYVAMDVKHSSKNYMNACGVSLEISNIVQSINLIINSKIDYEFRTTIVPTIHNYKNTIEISKLIHGAKRFALQKFIPNHAMDGSLRNEQSPSEKLMSELKAHFEQFIDEVIVR